MAQPTPLPGGGTPPAPPFQPPHDPYAGTTAGTTAPATAGDAGWTAPPVPSWTTPWPPPGDGSTLPPPPVPSRTATSRGPLVLGLVAGGGVLAGAVGGAFLVMAVFLSSAEDIGREIAAEVAPEVARETGDGVVEALGDLGLSMMDEGTMSEEFGSGPGSAPGPVEQHPAVEPGDLGPDPVLDQYAADCFNGTFQACDDLLYESPPLSEYEDYAITCGGRVKQWDVMACTDLE